MRSPPVYVLVWPSGLTATLSTVAPTDVRCCPKYQSTRKRAAVRSCSLACVAGELLHRVADCLHAVALRVAVEQRRALSTGAGGRRAATVRSAAPPDAVVWKGGRQCQRRDHTPARGHVKRGQGRPATARGRGRRRSDGSRGGLAACYAAWQRRNSIRPRQACAGRTGVHTQDASGGGLGTARRRRRHATAVGPRGPVPNARRGAGDAAADAGRCAGAVAPATRKRGRGTGGLQHPAL
eukprot:359648-Chlamydomonas_euryale.AAC.7